MGKPPRNRETVAAYIGLDGVHRPDPKVIKARLQELDARQASDDRTDVQRWLGDPPADRSALANRDSAGRTQRR